MDWLDWLRGLAALVATLALMLGVAMAARRFGMIRPRSAAVGARIDVLESRMLDPRRRLVVVRFDREDHLLLLSPSGDLVVGHAPAPLTESQAGPQTESPPAEIRP